MVPVPARGRPGAAATAATPRFGVYTRCGPPAGGPAESGPFRAVEACLGPGRPPGL